MRKKPEKKKETRGEKRKDFSLFPGALSFLLTRAFAQIGIEQFPLLAVSSRFFFFERCVREIGEKGGEGHREREREREGEREGEREREKASAASRQTRGVSARTSAPSLSSFSSRRRQACHFDSLHSLRVSFSRSPFSTEAVFSL